MNLPYQGLQEYPVKNITNLFQTGLRELVGARNMLTTGRRLLQVPEKGTEVAIVGEKSEIVKITFIEKKEVLLYLYYIPKTHRVDFYDSEGLVAVFEKKKCTWSRCTSGLKKLGFDDIFKPFVSLA